jgi:hypothetical protein
MSSLSSSSSSSSSASVLLGVLPRRSLCKASEVLTDCIFQTHLNPHPELDCGWRGGFPPFQHSLHHANSPSWNWPAGLFSKYYSVFQIHGPRRGHEARYTVVCLFVVLAPVEILTSMPFGRLSSNLASQYHSCSCRTQIYSIQLDWGVRVCHLPQVLRATSNPSFEASPT